MVETFEEADVIKRRQCQFFIGGKRKCQMNFKDTLLLIPQLLPVPFAPGGVYEDQAKFPS